MNIFGFQIGAKPAAIDKTEAVKKDGLSLPRFDSLSSPTALLLNSFSPSSAGELVNAQTAMSVATVYACARNLATDIAKLPLRMHKLLASGGHRIEKNHPLVKLLREPNNWQTSQEFWHHMVLSMQLRGNGFAYIRRDKSGNPIELIPLLPDSVSVRPDFEHLGLVWYHFTIQNQPGNQYICEAADMLHLKNISLDCGITGISPIVAAAQTIGIAIATQKSASILFRQGLQTACAIEHPTRLTGEASKNLSASIENAYGGTEKAHRVFVLEEGAKAVNLSISAEDYQLLESREFSGQEICRIFRMPNHKVQFLENSNYANMESENQSYVSDALTSIAVAIEQMLERRLLFSDERDNFEFRLDFDSMLRSDKLSRYQAYELGIANSILSPDECRISENMNVRNDGAGGEYRAPANTVVTTTTSTTQNKPSGGDPTPEDQS